MQASRKRGCGYSELEKSRLVEESLVPGANVSAIARREKIPPWTLFGWRRKVLGSRTATSKVPAVVAASPLFARVEVPRPPRIGMIEVEVGQVVVRAASDVDAEHLARLIRGILP